LIGFSRQFKTLSDIFHLCPGAQTPPSLCRRKIEQAGNVYPAACEVLPEKVV